jgi:hypothetical protein
VKQSIAMRVSVEGSLRAFRFTAEKPLLRAWRNALVVLFLQ